MHAHMTLGQIALVRLVMARERGLQVNLAGAADLMEQQRERARAAMKKNVVSVSEIETKEPTLFLGYESLETETKVLEIVAMKDQTAVVLDTSVCYAEMGGQVGDAGELIIGADRFAISNTQKVGNTWLHFLDAEAGVPALGESHLAVLRVDN